MNKGKEAFKLEGIVIPISVGSFTPAPISPIKKRIDEKKNFKKEEKRKKQINRGKGMKLEKSRNKGKKKFPSPPLPIDHFALP